MKSLINGRPSVLLVLALLIVPALSAFAAVEKELVGVWWCKQYIRGGTWELSFRITPQGEYTLTAKGPDSGKLEAANGRFKMSPAGGDEPFEGTYKAIDAHSVSMTGPAGTAIWKRMSDRGNGQNIDPILRGKLATDLVKDGVKTHMEMETGYYDTYTLTTTSEESGVIEAGQGKWKLSPKGGTPISGTYNMNSPTTFFFTGPDGETYWQKDEAASAEMLVSPAERSFKEDREELRQIFSQLLAAARAGDQRWIDQEAPKLALPGYVGWFKVNLGPAEGAKVAEGYGKMADTLAEGLTQILKRCIERGWTDIFIHRVERPEDTSAAGTQAAAARLLKGKVPLYRVRFSPPQFAGLETDDNGYSTYSYARIDGKLRYLGKMPELEAKP